MKHAISTSIALFCGVMASSGSLYAEKIHQFSETGKCETARTSVDYKRDKCSGTVCFRAHAIDFASVNSTAVSDSGSRYKCGSPYAADFEDAGFGLRRTTEVCADYNAWSKKGSRGGKGHMECRITGKYINSDGN